MHHQNSFKIASGRFKKSRTKCGHHTLSYEICGSCGVHSASDGQAAAGEWIRPPPNSVHLMIGQRHLKNRGFDRTFHQLIPR